MFTALWIWLYFLLDFILNSNTKSSISTNVVDYQDDISSQELDQENLSSEKVWSNNDLSFTSNSWSDTNNLSNEQNIISEVSSIETQSVNNFDVNVVDITGDDYIDTNLALLWNYDNKIKVNTLWEFSWYEENNNNEGWISTKQEQRTIESIPKVNFIPNINVKIHNLDNTFKVSDIITLKFDLILNSRSLKYSMTQKIYWDDFVINITPSDISSPLISIEENLVSEEIILPLDLMTKWKHKVGIKVNNLTKATYEFIVE